MEQEIVVQNTDKSQEKFDGLKNDVELLKALMAHMAKEHRELLNMQGKEKLRLRDLEYKLSGISFDVEQLKLTSGIT